MVNPQRNQHALTHQTKMTSATSHMHTGKDKDLMFDAPMILGAFAKLGVRNAKLDTNLAQLHQSAITPLTC